MILGNNKASNLLVEAILNTYWDTEASKSRKCVQQLPRVKTVLSWWKSMEDKSSSGSPSVSAAFPLRHCMPYPPTEQLNRRTWGTVTPGDRAQAHQNVKKVHLPEAAGTWYSTKARFPSCVMQLSVPGLTLPACVRNCHRIRWQTSTFSVSSFCSTYFPCSHT